MKDYNYITQSGHSNNKSDILNNKKKKVSEISLSSNVVYLVDIMQVNIVQISANEFWTTVLMYGKINTVTKIPKHYSISINWMHLKSFFSTQASKHAFIF